MRITMVQDIKGKIDKKWVVTLAGLVPDGLELPINSFDDPEYADKYGRWLAEWLGFDFAADSDHCIPFVNIWPRENWEKENHNVTT